jgi:hypothetical protein
MKNTILKYPFLGLIAALLIVLSCGKSVTELQPADPNLPPRSLHPGSSPDNDTVTTIVRSDTSATPTPPPPPFPQAPAPVASCSYAPVYGDSIIYPQPTSGQDYVVNPVNSPGAGKYLSWPVGMALDSLTGAIDVTKSQTGLRYEIGFIKSGTNDTCLNQLIIGGADYMDSVYVLDNGSTTAAPYYEANAYLPSICSGPGSGCSFDVTGSAAQKKVIVNTSTGIIDLQKTLNGTGLLGGAFGLLPLNGQTASATIYYRLNDPSNQALQHIDVEIGYFNSRSQINYGLLNSLTGIVGNILSGNIISDANPRPPLIIIVRHN